MRQQGETRPEAVDVDAEPGYRRFFVPDFQAVGNPMQPEDNPEMLIPNTLDFAAAYREWEQRGGQSHRTDGSTGVPIVQKLNFAQWLIAERNAVRVSDQIKAA